MKKLLTILITIIMCFSAFTFVGCGKQPLYSCIKCKEEVYQVKNDRATKFKMCDKCYQKTQSAGDGGH